MLAENVCFTKITSTVATIWLCVVTPFHSTRREMAPVEKMSAHPVSDNLCYTGFKESGKVFLSAFQLRIVFLWSVFVLSVSQLRNQSSKMCKYSLELTVKFDNCCVTEFQTHLAAQYEYLSVLLFDHSHTGFFSCYVTYQLKVLSLTWRSLRQDSNRYRYLDCCLLSQYSNHYTF